MDNKSEKIVSMAGPPAHVIAMSEKDRAEYDALVEIIANLYGATGVNNINFTGNVEEVELETRPLLKQALKIQNRYMTQPRSSPMPPPGVA